MPHWHDGAHVKHKLHRKEAHVVQCNSHALGSRSCKREGDRGISGMVCEASNEGSCCICRNTDNTADTPGSVWRLKSCDRDAGVRGISDARAERKLTQTVAFLFVPSQLKVQRHLFSASLPQECFCDRQHLACLDE